MGRTGSRVVGVAAIVLSLASAAVAVLYFASIIGGPGGPHMKHGLLFAAIFVILLLFGLISIRGGKKPAGQDAPK